MFAFTRTKSLEYPSVSNLQTLNLFDINKEKERILSLGKSERDVGPHVQGNTERKYTSHYTFQKGLFVPP